MGGPAWLSGVFAALMLTVAAYCTGRLVVARRWRRPTELDTDGAHIVMGVAMAGMLVSGLHTLPPAGWEGVFAVGAAWFGAQLLPARRAVAVNPWRCLHAGPHLVECAAMLYMLLVLPAAVAVRAPGAAMGGMAGSAPPSRFSFLALAMALFLLGYVAWLGDRLSARDPALARRLPGPLPTVSSPGNAAAAVPAGAAAAVPAGAAAAVPAGAAAPVPADAAIPGPPADASHGRCAGAAHGRPLLAPRCAVLCKIAMGITMGYMLILML